MMGSYALDSDHTLSPKKQGYLDMVDQYLLSRKYNYYNTIDFSLLLYICFFVFDPITILY